MKEHIQYKRYKGSIRLWCLTKWPDADINCSDVLDSAKADITVSIGDTRIGFVLSFDKSAVFLKQQILHCQKNYTRIYLVISEQTLTKKETSTFTKGMRLLNIVDPYNLGIIFDEISYN